jgi:hypothetical protein
MQAELQFGAAERGSNLSQSARLRTVSSSAGLDEFEFTSDLLINQVLVARTVMIGQSHSAPRAELDARCASKLDVTRYSIPRCLQQERNVVRTNSSKSESKSRIAVR